MLHLHDPSTDPDLANEDRGPPRGALGRGFVAWTRVCLRSPLVVLALALLSAVACAVWTGRNLGYKVSRVDLLDPRSDYNKLWIEYVREFGEEDDAVIVVEGESRDRVIAVLEELSREVAREPDLFHSVLHEVDLSRIRSKGLHYLSANDLADIDPREETLVIARTNRHVGRIAAILDDVGVPFRRVKAKQGSYNRDLGMAALWKLQHGMGATADEWTQAIDILPSKTSDGRTWLMRGAKSQWNKGLRDRFDILFPEDLPAVGATDHLRDAITSGAWSGLPDGGSKWASAAKRYGLEHVSNPKVQIGTVHSVKGKEATKVIVLSSVGRRIRESEENSQERHDEERRIEYVAVTRA
jgi:hypothetical protein